MNTAEAKEQMSLELGRLLGAPVVDFDTSVNDLGWDSMMLVELAVAAETVYERRIDLRRLDVDFDMTLNEILAQIDSAIRQEDGAGQAA